MEYQGWIQRLGSVHGRAVQCTTTLLRRSNKETTAKPLADSIGIEGPLGAQNLRGLALGIIAFLVFPFPFPCGTVTVVVAVELLPDASVHWTVIV